MDVRHISTARRVTRRGVPLLTAAVLVVPLVTVLAPPPAAIGASTSGDVYPLTVPKRLVDTRSGLGVPRARIGAGKTVTFQVSGKVGVPSSGSLAVILDVTSLGATRTTSLTVWPAGATRPKYPSLYTTAGRTVSNQAVVKLGTGGKVSLYNSAGSTNALVDVLGWATTGATAGAGARYVALPPATLLDTPAAIGARKTVTVAVAGHGGVPGSGATAAVLTLSGHSAAGTTTLTAYPYGATRPATPNVTLTRSSTTGNTVLVRLGSGKVAIYNATASTHVVVAVQGYFVSAASAPKSPRLAPLTTARIVDTSTGLNVSRAAIGAAATRTVPVAGKGGVATSAPAAVVNVVAKSATRNTALTVFPYGAVRPKAPTVYVAAGRTVATEVIAKLGKSGKVSIYNAAGSVQVALDVHAAFTPPPVTPPPTPAPVGTGAQSIYDIGKLLWSGSNPVQTGVDPATIKVNLASIVRGKVTDSKTGSTITGVKVTVLNHGEYGATTTQADGTFSMAVNGGSTLTVQLAKTGYSIAQRQVAVPVDDYAWVEKLVRLVPYDTVVTTVNATTATGETVASGSKVSDGDGSRTNRVFFPPGTDAKAVLPNGTQQDLGTLHVRATEFTVGSGGEDAMPAVLPRTSGYTYAVDLSVDEATSLGATDVEFTKPLANYVDNFLGFPVGTPVPAGYYDRELGRWVASQDGDVIKILAVNTSANPPTVVVDSDGDGYGDNLLGLDANERAKLAGLYTAGKTLWRVPITHFTPWDYNWPYGLPDGADGPGKNCKGCVPLFDRHSRDPCPHEGHSSIGCLSQNLGESIPVTGTGMTLNYSSERMPGRVSARTVTVPLIGSTVPPPIEAVNLEIDIAGQHHTWAWDKSLLTPGMSYTYTWDGKDDLGRPVDGTRIATIAVGFLYKGAYLQPGPFAASFALAGESRVVANRARKEIGLWQESLAELGTLTASTDGLGGWSLSVHHSYDPGSRTLYLGDGSILGGADAAQGVVTTLPVSDDLTDAQGIAAAPDGSVYVAGGTDNRIYRVRPNGTREVFAGTGDAGYTGDEGPAVDAELYDPTWVAVAPDGSVYFADRGQISRVREVGLDGIIHTVAGTFQTGYDGDDKLAVDALLDDPEGVAVGADGSLYIADTGNNRVRRVNPDGIITTVAGNGDDGSSGDGGPAVDAEVTPEGVAVGPDGSVYVAEGDRIRKVSVDGQISTIAGTGDSGYSGDGGPATSAEIEDVDTLAVARDGTVYFPQAWDDVVRVISPDGTISTGIGTGVCDINRTVTTPDRFNLCEPSSVAIDIDDGVIVLDYGYGGTKLRRLGQVYPGFATGEIAIPNADATQVYVFDRNGRHLRTVDGLTGTVRYTFAYTASGVLDHVTDGYGNVTQILRDADGKATAIVAPGGQTTALTLGSDGYLASVTDPAGASHTLGYGTGGLLTSLTDRTGATSTFGYDADGRLTVDAGPDSAATTLARQTTSTTETVVVTTPEGRTTTFKTERLVIPLGGVPVPITRQTVTDASGASTVTDVMAGGTSTETTRPDGEVIRANMGPDPRFGMLAPVYTNVRMAEPVGPAFTVAATYSATLSNPGDPFNPTSLDASFVGFKGTATMHYDGSTRTFTWTTPGGRSWTRSVDARGRLVATRGAPGLQPQTYAYDDQGRLTDIVHGAIHLAYGYDDKNRVTSVTDALGDEQTFTYDPDGRVVGTANGSIHYTFTRDGEGRLKTLTMPSGATHTFGYDTSGQLTSYAPPDSASYVLTYNKDRWLVSTKTPSETTHARAYDDANRLTALNGPNVAQSIGYDAASRPTTLSRTDGNGPAQGLALTYNGDLVTDAVASGWAQSSYHFTYDALADLYAVTLDSNAARVIDRDDDQLVTQDGPFSLARSGPNGAVSSITDGTATRTSTYDDMGRLHSETTTVGGTTRQVSYAYDADDRISQRVDNLSGSSVTTTYGYDADGRLTSVTHGGSLAEQYGYDPNANRTSADVAGTSASSSYDTQDRTTSVGAAAYAFNADGQLTGRGGDTFSYTASGQLASATVGGQTVTYHYDGQRRLVSRTVAGQTWQFLYGDPRNDLRVTATRAPSGELTEYWYDDSNRLYAFTRGGVRHYVVTDPTGTPSAVIGAGGGVEKQVTRDAFGRVLADSAPGFELLIGFAGGLEDPLTGLVHFGFRDYDPASAHWTTRDPSLFSSGVFNLYEYAADDPVDVRDPTGLGNIQIEVKLGAGAVVDLKIQVGSGGISGCLGGGVGGAGSVQISAGSGRVDTETHLYGESEVSLGPGTKLKGSVKLGPCGNSSEIEGCLGGFCGRAERDWSTNELETGGGIEDEHEFGEEGSHGFGVGASMTAGACSGVAW